MAIPEGMQAGSAVPAPLVTASWGAADWRELAIGLGFAVLATLLAYALVRAAFALRRSVRARLNRGLQALPSRLPAAGLLATYAEHAHALVRFVTSVVCWAVVLLVVDGWLAFVLRQFAYTRPWGERSTQWLLEVLTGFALAVAGAVPGLVTAVLIFAFARLVSRANTLFLDKVEQGGLKLSWLDVDTAGPTRRLSNLLIWLFALAMAYPYLPGSGSEAFKGLSVLAGLMLSLGASSVVGQALSGLSLMYSRALRVGEYVRVGECEGTVSGIGLFTTRIQTGLREEISLPNSVVFSQPIRNFSRRVEGGSFVIHTTVTIGYATPWRQVHAMLLQAAARTEGVAQQPPPFVVQTALSDFYVEYRLCAQATRLGPNQRAQAISQLNSHIQDVFNEQGVQIMSPHYMADPPQPQVVPHGEWFPATEPAPPRHENAPRPAASRQAPRGG